MAAANPSSSHAGGTSSTLHSEYDEGSDDDTVLLPSARLPAFRAAKAAAQAGLKEDSLQEEGSSQLLAPWGAIDPNYDFALDFRNVGKDPDGATSRDEVFDCDEITSSNGYNTEYAEVANQSLCLLANIVLGDEATDPRTANNLGGWSAKDLSHMGVNILITANAKVLRGLLKGNLAREYATDPDLKKEMDSIAYYSRYFPSIYMHSLVDKHGVTPTLDQMRKIIKYLRIYANGGSKYNEFINAVDNRRQDGKYTLVSTIGGTRKYLPPPKWREGVDPPEESAEFDIPSTEKVAQLEEMCAAMSDYLDMHLTEHGNTCVYEPLPEAFTEIGYCITSEGRLKNHHNHASSTNLMNLTEAICEVMGDRELLEDLLDQAEFNQALLDRAFGMQQHVIHIIVFEQMAYSAEIFFSRMTRSYTWLGRGFNHHTAGLSNASIWTVKDEVWKAVWKWQDRYSPYRDNIALHRAKVLTAKQLIELRDQEVAFAELQPFIHILNRSPDEVFAANLFMFHLANEVIPVLEKWEKLWDDYTDKLDKGVHPDDLTVPLIDVTSKFEFRLAIAAPFFFRDIDESFVEMLQTTDLTTRKKLLTSAHNAVTKHRIRFRKDEKDADEYSTDATLPTSQSLITTFTPLSTSASSVAGSPSFSTQ